MAFKVIVSLVAKKVLPERFYNEFLEIISLLETQPFFEKKLDLIRTCKLKSFPYLAHFVVNEETSVVKIIAVTFGKRGNNNFGYRILEP